MTDKRDPVRHCPVYRAEGCAHVDGPLCDMATCSSLEQAQDRQVIVFGARRCGKTAAHHEKLWEQLNELGREDAATHALMASYAARYPLGLSQEARIEMLLQLAIYATKEKKRLLEMLTSQAMLRPAPPIVCCPDCPKLEGLKK